MYIEAYITCDIEDYDSNGHYYFVSIKGDGIDNTLAGTMKELPGTVYIK